MREFLEEIIKGKKDDLSSDKRNLLSIAYKKTISPRIQSLRNILAYEIKVRKKGDDSDYLPYISEYKKKIETE